MSEGREVGVVTAVYRYPVKSMAGQSLDAARADWHGLEGDRRYAFVRGGDTSDFPWLTGRRVRDMLRYVPVFVDPAAPETSPVRVRLPDGRALDLTSKELAAHLAAQGGPVQLLRSFRGVFDAFPLSLISHATVAGIAAAAGRELRPRRFRPNLVVETPDGEPFPEDGWTGAALAFGDGPDALRMRVDVRDPRCAMVNFDPDTAERDPVVLRTVVRERDNHTGVYGSVERPGRVAVGDVVRRR